MLISSALAQSNEIASQSAASSFIPLILVIVVFYFLLIRPQQVKIKQHQKMVSDLKIGDKVVTSGGIYGKIGEIKDQILSLKIAKDVEIKIDKNQVAHLDESASDKKEEKNKKVKSKK